MFENINLEKVAIAVSFILSHLSWIAVYGILLLLVFVLPKYIFSAARSILAHMLFYIETAVFCLFFRMKFSIKRFPFASFFRLSKNCDISITDGESIYRIHLLSLISPFKTAVTISRDGLCLTYISSASFRKRISEEGTFLLLSRDMLGYSSDKKVKMPEFDKVNKINMTDVVLICPKPLLICSAGGYGELYGIEEINGILWGSYRNLYKFLRRNKS